MVRMHFHQQFIKITISYRLGLVKERAQLCNLIGYVYKYEIIGSLNPFLWWLLCYHTDAYINTCFGKGEKIDSNEGSCQAICQLISLYITYV